MQTRSHTNRIIIHHSLSGDVSVDTIRDWHIERGFVDVGYHFIVRESGAVESGRHLHLVGAHAKGRNGDSVGICVVGDFNKTQPTLFQYYSLARVIKSLNVIYCKDLSIEYHQEKCTASGFDRDFFEGIL